MNHSYHTTPAQAPAILAEMVQWPSHLQQLHQQMRPYFARLEPWQHTLLYLQAVLSEIPRKNGWQIAEHARQARPYGMQRLLSRAIWDHDGVRNVLRTLLCHTLTPPATSSDKAELLFPILVVDESGCPKRGTHSPGVAHQYCGLTSRVENCQVGVFLSFVTAHGHGLIDRELYLPQVWGQDQARRQAAHLPETVTFQTKPELARLMLQRTLATGLRPRWVAADTVYGHSTDLRLFLEEQDLAYALAVPSTEVVGAWTPTGPRLADVATLAAQWLTAEDWHRLSASLGTKGERLFDWARLPLLHHGILDGHFWLVVRRCLDDPLQLAYYLVFAPLDTPLPLMVEVIGTRWHIEEDLQNAKDLGLDQYEGRTYVGWYRHITLVLLAAAFLLALGVQEPEAPEQDAPLIPLTRSEVSHLLAHLFWPPPTSVPFIMQWSQWRRTHQYWAGYYHCRRRQKAG